MKTPTPTSILLESLLHQPSVEEKPIPLFEPKLLTKILSSGSRHMTVHSALVSGSPIDFELALSFRRLPLDTVDTRHFLVLIEAHVEILIKQLLKATSNVETR